MRLPRFMTVRNVDPHHLHRYLLPHEEDAVVIRRHPALLLRYIAEFIAGLIVAGVLSGLVSQGAVLAVIWALWFAVLGRLVFKVYEWSDEFFAVTGVRVMLVHGLFTRKVDMMPLSKITDLTVDRSIIGRMLGYGTVVLESAGQDQALSKVEYVPEPEGVYLQISAVAFGSGDD
ncbi:PH domain-containing protein [Actinoallomurus rhizosphaericola]|uniref:PH domain-containing protein n=1 Tax=Actinoallomurus rhizosphaericola TaxID=2952536 RepID=UPI0038735C07